MSQTRLSNFGSNSAVDLLLAYVAVSVNESGVLDHARATDRAPGTVGNLLRRAERILGERR